MWNDAISALRAVLNTPLAAVDESLPDGAEFSRLSTERAELLQAQRRIRADINAGRAFSKDEKTSRSSLWSPTRSMARSR